MTPSHVDTSPASAERNPKAPSTARNRVVRQILGGSIAALGVGMITVLAASGGSEKSPVPGPREPSTASFPALSSRAPGEQTPTADPISSPSHAPATGDSERIQALRERAEDATEGVEARRRLARALLEEEHWIEAFQVADRLRSDHPGDPEALYVLGLVRLRMRRNREALGTLEELVSEHPDHVDGHHALGFAMLRLGRAQEAVDVWERGLNAAGGHHDELERLLAVSRNVPRTRDG